MPIKMLFMLRTPTADLACPQSSACLVLAVLEASEEWVLSVRDQCRRARVPFFLSSGAEFANQFWAENLKGGLMTNSRGGCFTRCLRRETAVHSQKLLRLLSEGKSL